MTDTDRLAALLHEERIGCAFSTRHTADGEPVALCVKNGVHDSHAARLAAAGVTLQPAAPAEGRRTIEGLPPEEWLTARRGYTDSIHRFVRDPIMGDVVLLDDALRAVDVSQPPAPAEGPTGYLPGMGYGTGGNDLSAAPAEGLREERAAAYCAGEHGRHASGPACDDGRRHAAAPAEGLAAAAQPILDRALDVFDPDDLDPESSLAMPVTLKARWVYALRAALWLGVGR